MPFVLDGKHTTIHIIVLEYYDPIQMYLVPLASIRHSKADSLLPVVLHYKHAKDILLNEASTQLPL